MTGDAQTQHEFSAVDTVADDYLQASSALDPCTATVSGISGYDDLWPDYSADGYAERDALVSRTLARLDAVSGGDHIDPIDSVTIASLRERLQIQRDLATAGRVVGALNVIESPLQMVRDTLDVQGAQSPAQRQALLTRLESLPRVLDSIVAGLAARKAALTSDLDWPVPIRQVRGVITQAAAAADLLVTHLERTDASQADSSRISTAIASACEDLGRYLSAEILPVATTADACGPDTYQLHSREFLGASVDMEQTYLWGQHRLEEIVARQREVARTLYGDDDVTATLRRLDTEPRYTIYGTDDLARWMQDQADAVIDDLSEEQFDIAPELRRIDCRIAQSGTGGIYYTAPSEDLSRPGTMWWSVPPQQRIFHTWQEKTTVFHEGVPGHHLQIGVAVTSPQLNRWRRTSSFVSGHGEGWALYAEALMADLGYLDDPGDLMGMLDSQRLRAARVVVDIGVHCRFAAPASVGGGSWTYEKAWQFLRGHVATDEAVLRFELDRYLGWPGQAPSYSVGQRIWEQLRDEYLVRHPGKIREFHRRALAIGGVGLDTLASALRS